MGGTEPADRYAFLMEMGISHFLRTGWTASVVKWSEFLATDKEDLGSIPSATRFSEK
jgi:hypothetical protein